MQQKYQLTLEDVKKIAQAAEAEALAHQWAVSIAIVDDGGHLLWLQRLDGAAPISAHIAPAKAHIEDAQVARAGIAALMG